MRLKTMLELLFGAMVLLGLLFAVAGCQNEEPRVILERCPGGFSYSYYPLNRDMRIPSGHAPVCIPCRDANTPEEHYVCRAVRPW